MKKMIFTILVIVIVLFQGLAKADESIETTLITTPGLTEHGFPGAKGMLTQRTTNGNPTTSSTTLSVTSGATFFYGTNNPGTTGVNGITQSGAITIQQSQSSTGPKKTY